MNHSFRRNPLGLAVCGALALPAGAAQAQGFDVNSSAVREAYVGVATQEKKDAALAGLGALVKQLGQIPGPCITCGGGVIVNQDNPGPIISLTPPSLINSTIQAASDGDLGAPGAVVTLNNTLLRALANFSTPRDFTIGTGGATIDTNGFNLSITGTLTADGMLVKNGLGTLALTGNNVWNQMPIVVGAMVMQGVLEGNSSSLQTSLFNNATLRFNQSVDGIYAGVMSSHSTGNFEKTGNGKLTLINTNAYRGSTSILAGTLALQGAGSLGLTSALTVSAGASFDMSATNALGQSVGMLSGAGTIVLGPNGLLYAESNSDSTFSGSISGAGSVGKAGVGTLTLTGNNTYAGTTIVDAGTLALAGQGRLNSLGAVILFGTFDIARSSGAQQVGSIWGINSSEIKLGANSLTVGADNTSSSFAGIISGSGGLSKTGSGRLELSGVNTYAGVTTIDQGTLVARTYSISDRVINNAALRLADDKSTTAPFLSSYSGNISGTGQLVKEGGGMIWLRGRNSYTGGTTVNSGLLIGNTDSLQGNIVNNAALAFYQVDNGIYAGTLSGSGSLYQYGPGVLTLTGNNTYTGGTAFSGTLRVERDANLGAANGALLMAGGTLQIGADMTTARTIVLGPDGGAIDTNGYKLSTDVAGRISGPGALTKTGAGTLSLNGTDDPFAVAVKAGRLEINNLLTTNNIAVATGAELGGSGYIFGNVSNSGRLARGGGIGAINVEGHVTFEPGSVFSVKADAAGNNDRLVLTNHRAILFANAPATANAPLPPRATLNGGTVEVRAEAGNYRRETRYNIITADGGVTGQFNGVTSNLAFLTPGLAYDPNNVYLTLTRNDLDYAAIAHTANQGAVARSLMRMANGAPGDAATVTAALDGLSAPQARAAFDAIGAAGRAALPQVGALNQRAANQNLVARLAIADDRGTLAPASGIAGRSLQLAFDESTRNDAAPAYAQAAFPGGGQGLRAGGGNAGNNGLWLRGYGGAGRIDGDANAPGADYHFGGTLVGYDRKLSDHLTLGVYAGYARPRYSQDVAASSAKANSAQAGVYGRYASGAWHVDGIASYAHNDTDTSRVVSVGGLNRVAAGSFHGDAWSAHVETGYTLKAGSFDVQPLAGLSWTRQHQNAYSETGAGALNLILSDQSQTSLRSSVGARTLHPFTSGGTQWAIETRAAWSHEFKNQRNINARLAGDPAAGVFTVSGPDAPRDSAVVGLGIAAQAGKNLRLYADANAEFNGASRAYAVSAGLRYQW